eukprot:TRINITY_DN2784_c0_g2_i1.p1 TRINITY_DN2784_c0_g2~~TRINITY_DN2784_c0_g2_i1.p1  ORF type:complete len:264 (-),score=41.32 TRINITY_DN2784_c0_g2_i1:34-825(-)
MSLSLSIFGQRSEELSSFFNQLSQSHHPQSFAYSFKQAPKSAFQVDTILIAYETGDLNDFQEFIRNAWENANPDTLFVLTYPPNNGDAYEKIGEVAIDLFAEDRPLVRTYELSISDPQKTEPLFHSILHWRYPQILVMGSEKKSEEINDTFNNLRAIHKDLPLSKISRNVSHSEFFEVDAVVIVVNDADLDLDTLLQHCNKEVPIYLLGFSDETQLAKKFADYEKRLSSSHKSVKTVQLGNDKQDQLAAIASEVAQKSGPERN